MIDQLVYGLALISPYVGLFMAWTIVAGIKGPWRWLLSLIVPVAISSGFGYLLFQIPAQGIRLLIISYGLSLYLTLIHLLIWSVLFVGKLFDGLKLIVSWMVAKIFTVETVARVEADTKEYPRVIIPAR